MSDKFHLEVPQRYRRRLSAFETQRLVDLLTELLDDISDDAAEVVGWRKERQRDGYATTVRRDQGGQRGAAADPTLSAVIANEAHNALDEAAPAMCAWLLVARDALRSAVGARDRARRVTRPATAPSEESLDYEDAPVYGRKVASGGCVNCYRAGVWSAIHKAGRCTACYFYRRRHPELGDAPVDVVVEREEKRTAA